MQHTNTEPDIPIVHEDDHVLVINKPHGLLSQEDQTGDPDVLTLCKKYLSRQRQSAGQPYLGLLHRLDRPVGGLMMLAKTSRAADRLSRQIRDRTIQKTYWAVVDGEAPANGMLTHYLLKDRDRNVVETSSPDNRQAKEAILSFARLEESEDDLNLLSIHLQTGRPHQIRVQLAAEGYPVWGDYKYGKQNQPEGRTMALRSVELSFQHPATADRVDFRLPPSPADPWNAFSLDKHL